MSIHDDVKSGDVDAVARQLDAGIEVEARDERKDYTPLMVAVVSDLAGVDMVRLLIGRGADVNAFKSEDWEKEKVLTLAVREGTLEKVEALLDAGADILYQSETGYNILIHAMHSRAMGEGAPLLPLVELLLARGASPLGESDWSESALSVASYNGRFDVVKRLLAAGADVALLQWDDLLRAVALGSVSDVERLIQSGADLVTRDRWKRTPWLLSLQIGALDKAKILLASGADLGESGNCGQTPLMHAIEGDHAEIVSWLIEQGADLDAKNEFGATALTRAAERGATECVRRLLQAQARADISDAPESPRDMREILQSIDPDLVDGMDDDYLDESSGRRAIHKAANIEIVRLLAAAGEDIAEMDDEVRAMLLGLETEGEVCCSREEYLAAKHRRFGTANPEPMDNAFWRAMVRCGVTAYRARATFGDTDTFRGGAVWSYHRFGKSFTELPDGRIIEVGGEHEDAYDPDFCIYNDVFVHRGENSGGAEFEIFGYPQAVFPPTDFHSATLVGEWIYIIGGLGYSGTRVSGETPVYRLHCASLKIEKLETNGEKPGWINSHRAVYQPGDDGNGEIRVWNGKIWEVVDGDEDYFNNSDNYILNLDDLSWGRAQN